MKDTKNKTKMFAYYASIVINQCRLSSSDILLETFTKYPSHVRHNYTHHKEELRFRCLHEQTSLSQTPP